MPERELATMKAGLPVQLQVDALPERTFTGTVDRVAPVVDAGRHRDENPLGRERAEAHVRSLDLDGGRPVG